MSIVLHIYKLNFKHICNLYIKPQALTKWIEHIKVIGSELCGLESPHIIHRFHLHQGQHQKRTNEYQKASIFIIV